MSDIANVQIQVRASASRGMGRGRSLMNAVIGLSGLLALWWLGGWCIANDPDMAAFANFAPAPTLSRLVQMFVTGEVIEMSTSSLSRVGFGLFYAIAIGVPMGILVGRGPRMHEITNVPFQFLRMISPLAWMPFAVMLFSSWDGAIIFLITMAALWPILFSTAAGVRRIDPAWLKVARNLGANPFHMLFTLILPAISIDVLGGIRLALGVAWIVLVPAEYLGVSSGLGFAINDARDTLDYARLAATVVVIGIIGFTLDALAGLLVQKFNWMRGGS